MRASLAIALLSVLGAGCAGDTNAEGDQRAHTSDDVPTGVTAPDDSEPSAQQVPPAPRRPAASTPEGAQTPAPEATPAPAGANTSADPSRNGPYSSTKLTNTGPNSGYTVYLPASLPAGTKAPIVGWMSGGGTTHEFYPLLPKLATHGIVVVAANVIPGIGSEVQLGKQIIAGIDWAIAENTRAGSPLFGKLDTTKLASMGYSMGSLATFTIANDERLTTTVHISGGNFEPARVKNLRAPAAFICGTPNPSCANILANNCDIAAAQCDTDFQNATTPVFYANFPGGHLGVLGEPHGSRIGTVATGWLRWKLLGDESHAATFVGSDCALCKDGNWKVRQKNLTVD